MENINYYFKPIRAMVFYTPTDKLDDSYSFNKTPAVRVYSVLESENGYQLGSGKPVAQEDLDQIAREFNTIKEKQPLRYNGLIDERMLYFQGNESSYQVVWFTKPTKHALIFGSDLAKELKNGNYNLPGLIFKATRKELQVYAFKGTERPTAKTVLCIPPTFNTANDGDVCMGSVKVKTVHAEVEKIIYAWAKGFFRSKFSHPSHEEMIKGANIYDVYNSVYENDVPFPEQHLIELDKRLEDLI